MPSHGSTSVYCDNDAAVCLAEDHMSHSQVKHIQVKFHMIREYIDLGDISVLRGYLGLHDNATRSM